MRVLITGATGYIGSAVARAVADAGHEVLALAHHDEAEATFTDRGYTPAEGNLRDLDSLRRWPTRERRLCNAEAPDPRGVGRSAGGPPSRADRRTVHGVVPNTTSLPAFGGHHRPEEMVAITAFVTRLPGLSADEYEAMAGGDGGHRHGGTE